MVVVGFVPEKLVTIGELPIQAFFLGWMSARPRFPWIMSLLQDLMR
jgi:hypothetical protein